MKVVEMYGNFIGVYCFVEFGCIVFVKLEGDGWYVQVIMIDWLFDNLVVIV